MSTPPTRCARPRGWSALLSALLISSAAAQEREAVVFEFSHAAAAGQAVYVSGNIPELGNDNKAYAVRLDLGSETLWRVSIAIRKDVSYTYRFLTRNDSVSQWSNPGNGAPISPDLAGQTGPRSVRPAAKGLYYLTTWTAPTVHWRLAGTTDPFAVVPLVPAGPGRTPGEGRWKAVAIPAAQRTMEFYFTNSGAGRDPVPGLNYSTPLDAMFIQDGNVFAYLAPATFSAPQQTNFGTFPSAALGENRPYRILLPRGYAQNPQKRYPVLYMHDGQNVFDMGAFGTWDADAISYLRTRFGQMREIIIVAVDNTANRLRDYMPPDDIVPSGPGAGQPGRANLYAQYLINELKPVIDANYRTLPDRGHTGVMGSSMGGLVSAYLGWDYDDTFGRVGAMSGSWQFDGFLTRVLADPYRDLRIYLDSGDSGASSDNARPTMNLRNDLLRKGYVLEADLRHVVGYGHQHNEAAWAARLPGALAFLFPPTEEQDALYRELFRGDANCDAVVNFDDIDAFVAALLGEEAYATVQPDCDRLLADINADGAVTFDDVDGFVRCLVAECP